MLEMQDCVGAMDILAKKSFVKRVIGDQLLHPDYMTGSSQNIVAILWEIILWAKNPEWSNGVKEN